MKKGSVGSRDRLKLYYQPDLQESTLVTTIQARYAAAADALAKRLPDMLKRIINQLPSNYTDTLGTSIDEVVKLANIEVANDQIHITIRGNDKKSLSKMLAAILPGANVGCSA